MTTTIIQAERHCAPKCYLPTCAGCMVRMVRTSRLRSPLAIMVFGFEDIFKAHWGFVPDPIYWKENAPAMTVATFHPTSVQDGHPGYKERDGWRVTIVRKLTEDEVDEEVGYMYEVVFVDGVATHAFSDELVPLESESSGDIAFLQEKRG